MPVLLAANVERRPIAFPVEGQAVFGLVFPPCRVEVIKVDVAGSVGVEEAEDNLVLGIGFREEVLEDGPVVYADPSFAVSIGNLEQNAILIPLDLVLERTRH